MEHLDFILWMTLFPISVSICRHLDSKIEHEEDFSDGAKLFASIVIITLWLGIGYSLY
jgi:hypothetical protein